MVPVNWALASADVNAGTARAARIAIIAITTSSSISVNAEESLFNLIFIFGFFNCSCSEGFACRSPATAGQRRGSQRVLFLFWGFGFRLLFGSFPGFWSENVGAYRSLHRQSQ